MTIVVRVVRSIEHTSSLYRRLGAKILAMAEDKTIYGKMSAEKAKALAAEATARIQKDRETQAKHKAKIDQAKALLAMNLDPSTRFDVTETSVKVHTPTSSTDSSTSSNSSSSSNSDNSKTTQALCRGFLGRGFLRVSCCVARSLDCLDMILGVCRLSAAAIASVANMFTKQTKSKILHLSLIVLLGEPGVLHMVR